MSSPAKPVRRTPKTLAALPQGLLDQSGHAKEYVYRIVLCRIAELQAEAEESGAGVRFAPEADKQYDCIENYTRGRKKGERYARPIIAKQEAADALLVPLIGIANFLSITAKPADTGLPAMVDFHRKRGEPDDVYADDVRAMEVVVAARAAAIGTDAMAREFDYGPRLSAALAGLVTPGRGHHSRTFSEATTLYLKFLRCLAWEAGNAVWVLPKYTFNIDNALLLFRNACGCATDADSRRCLDGLFARVESQVGALHAAPAGDADADDEDEDAKRPAAPAKRPAKTAPPAAPKPAAKAAPKAAVEVAPKTPAAAGKVAPKTPAAAPKVPVPAPKVPVPAPKTPVAAPKVPAPKVPVPAPKTLAAPKTAAPTGKSPAAPLPPEICTEEEAEVGKTDYADEKYEYVAVEDSGADDLTDELI